MVDDIVIKTGTVIDGSATAGKKRDVFIFAGKIREIGDCSGIAAGITIFDA